MCVCVCCIHNGAGGLFWRCAGRMHRSQAAGVSKAFRSPAHSLDVAS